MSNHSSRRPSAAVKRDSVSRGSVLLSALEGLAARDAAAATSPSRGSIRASGRYSQSSNHRGRASVARGSVRAGGGARGTALDSSGLPFERILCIDPEDGRDRTPKPLVAARPHGAAEAAWASSEGPATAVGAGGDASAGPGSGGRLSVMSFGGALLPGGIPSARSFLGSEAGDALVDGSGFLGMDSGRARRRTRQSTMHHGGGEAAVAAPAAAATPAPLASPVAQKPGGGSGGRADSQPIGGLFELGRGEAAESPHEQQQHHSLQQQRQREQLRSKATQCPPVALASRGVQVLPWELGAAGGGGAEEAGEASPAAQHAGPDAGDHVGEDEEALLAMMQQGDGGGGASGRGGESHRASPTPSSRSLHSQASSRRQSAAGSGRRSTVHGGGGDWDLSRRSSMQSGADGWSGRDSVSAASGRTSYAAFMSDGRASIVSSVGGWYPQPGSPSGRGSVMSVGGARRGSTAVHSGGRQEGQAPQAPPPPPQLSPAEALAREQQRQRAEQERALARLPGLLERLQVAERAVLLDSHHPQLACARDVQLCRRPSEAAAGGTVGERRQVQEAADAGSGSNGEQQSATAVEASAPAPAAEASGARSAAPLQPAPLANALPGAATPLGTGRPAAKEELRLLWAWRSELSGELPVSCLAFNRAAPGLLAVGYGRLEYCMAGEGLVAVWSLANPARPLWRAAMPCGVSALDWSGKAPACLAVGFFDGSLALYDVRSRPAAAAPNSSGAGGASAAVAAAPQPLARTPPAGPGGAAGGHSEPVWRLRHVPRPSDPSEEMLVSVSSDGRVLEWKGAQGLERSELLRLKRQQGAAAAAARQHLAQAAPGASSGKEGSAGAGASAAQVAASAAEGYLGRAAGATCFDFSPADPRAYLVGTEEGAVHRCSTAFSEQAAQAFLGHLAPVYQVCWSPFSPAHFLTASADWSVRLWADGCPKSLWSFQLPAAKAEVADVAWCPAAPTLFAAAAGNTLQLWDMERSVLAPRASATRFGVRLTALAFCRAAPVVVVGADDGAVSVYSLAGMYDPDAAAAAAADEAAREEGRQRLEAALRLHTAQHVSD